MSYLRWTRQIPTELTHTHQVEEGVQMAVVEGEEVEPVEGDPRREGEDHGWVEGGQGDLVVASTV